MKSSMAVDHNTHQQGLTLDALQPGQRARIARYRKTDDVAQRLLEMGLTPGTPVTLVRRAPLGDPIDILVRGYHLSLRHREAALLEVTLIGGGVPGPKAELHTTTV